jgi:hypothetical protein
MAQKNQQNPKNPNHLIEKELRQLHEEREKSKIELENMKKKLANEIKIFDIKEIKNTIVVEKKYTIWQRLKKVLGMN